MDIVQACYSGMLNMKSHLFAFCFSAEMKPFRSTKQVKVIYERLVSNTLDFGLTKPRPIEQIKCQPIWVAMQMQC